MKKSEALTGDERVGNEIFSTLVLLIASRVGQSPSAGEAPAPSEHEDEPGPLIWGDEARREQHRQAAETAAEDHGHVWRRA